MLKTRLGISDTADDAQLRRLLEAASRAADRHCDRHFYAKTETKYLDGKSYTEPIVDRYTQQLVSYAVSLRVSDLLSVSTLKLDSDRDAAYENTLVATDYVLYPYEGFPKTRIELDQRQGDYSYWPRGQRIIQIAGLWGYGDGRSATPYEDSGATLTVANGTATTVAASDGSLLAAGQTVLCESEQMYIRSISGNSLTVVRAVNGTTGAAHSGKAASVYQYPEQVAEAVVLMASRLWKRKDTSYATVIASPEFGGLEVYRGVDPDVALLLQPLVKMQVAAV
jgi:hypothetical protein